MSNPLAALAAVTNSAAKPKPFEIAAQKKEHKAEQKEAKAALTVTSAPLSLAQKLKALDDVRAKLNKQFSTNTTIITNSIMTLGSRIGQDIPHTPTNIVSLDEEVLGIGGVPDGRIIEIFGPESSGKTTIALEFIAEEQKAGNLAAFVDAEHALDPNYAAKLGVDVNLLQIAQPDSGEQALETVEALVRSRAVSIVVIDSVAALVPQAELDGEMGDAHMGLQARLMSQAMRKLRGIAAINGVTLVFINQLRERVGVSFGNPEVTSGGKALKFYASVRLDIRRVSKTDGGEIMSGEVLVGHKMKIKAIKNKGAAPFRSTIVDLIYGVGVDRFADMVDYAVKIGVLDKQGGGWIYFEGERLSQGVANTVALLRDDPEKFAKVKAGVKAALKAIREAEIADQKAKMAEAAE
jgi:recombination protein RecA